MKDHRRLNHGYIIIVMYQYWKSLSRHNDNGVNPGARREKVIERRRSRITSAERACSPSVCGACTILYDNIAICYYTSAGATLSRAN